MDEEQNESIAVRNLQTYLREISLYYPEITPPPVDGIFKDQTRQSLIDFQTASGLQPTGIADQETFEALYIAYRLVRAQNQPPLKVAVFSSDPENLLRLGDTGFDVRTLQYMLGELEAFYGEIGPLEQTGVFDEATENAVGIFQRKNGIPESKEVGRTTWNVITDQYNQLFNGNPPL